MDKAKTRAPEFPDDLPQSTRMMLLAAWSAQVPIPSDTFDRLGIAFPFDWRKLNRFQATYPVQITHDENGHPLPSLKPGRPQFFLEAEE